MTDSSQTVADISDGPSIVNRRARRWPSYWSIVIGWPQWQLMTKKAQPGQREGQLLLVTDGDPVEPRPNC